MTQWTKDYITVDQARTLTGLFEERVKRSANLPAYQYFDKSSASWKTLSWQNMRDRILECERRIAAENFKPGDRVGIMSPNSPWWIVFEQAAMRLGLVTVPLFPNDRADNVAYISNDSDIKIVLINDIAQWEIFREAKPNFRQAPKLVSVTSLNGNTSAYPAVTFDAWIKEKSTDVKPLEIDPMSLATIVYTSGTTGKPKGVMLSHHNIVTDAYYGINSVDVFKEDLFLSFLPLSHTLERTVGYYLPVMTGSCVAFCRSIPELAEDLVNVKPTVLISVPRIFERVYGKIQAQLKDKSPIAKKLFDLAVSVGYQKFEIAQGRRGWSPRVLLWPLLNKLVAHKIIAKLGGRMRFSISGGAALSKPIAETFIGLGLPVLQGYGLTEASPVISVNRMKQNIPESIGPALPNIDVRISNEGELQTRSTCLMMGYWNNEKATKECFTPDGWLRTGDLARIDEKNHIYIIGRLKDILVMSNGEKVPPDDIQMAITLDSLFEQALVIGEAKPYLVAIIVLASTEWEKFARSLNLDPNNRDNLQNKTVVDTVVQRIDKNMSAFPGYAHIRQVTLTLDPWTDANGYLTPSMKLKRKPIMEKFKKEIEGMYKGH